MLVVLLALALAVYLSSCAGLPQRTYSLNYTSPDGQTIGAGVTLGDTRLIKDK